MCEAWIAIISFHAVDYLLSGDTYSSGDFRVRFLKNSYWNVEISDAEREQDDTIFSSSFTHCLVSSIESGLAGMQLVILFQDLF